jgi:uncharacterized protein with HEPN domain
VKKDAETFIEHILECIALIEEYSENKTVDDFLDSVQLQDAIIRRIEIIGEAVKNIPNAIKAEHPEIPWKKIAGMRDIIIHEYFGIDLELTWEVITRDLPDLKKKMLRIRENLESS